MTERTRPELQREFQDGERPSGEDFADLLDSFLNKLDDGVQVELGRDRTLVVPGGLGLADSSDETPGTLRFNGTTVELFDGSGWVSLVGSGAFQPMGSEGAVAFSEGNVGIGALETAPEHRLEVRFESADEGERGVRLGNSVCRDGGRRILGAACFAHVDHRLDTDVALIQHANGSVRLNAPSAQEVVLSQNSNRVRLLVSADGNIVIGTSRELAAAGGASLQVDGGLYLVGDAVKTNSDENWTVACDARLKEDVRDLEAGLRQLLQVRPVRFRYNGKAGTPAGREGIGILGQEMARVFPDMVKPGGAPLEGDPGGGELLFYNGSGLTYVLVNAVKELAARVQALESGRTDTGGAFERQADEADG